MPWQLTESSATGRVGTSRMEVFPASPERPVCLDVDPQSGNPWQIAAVKPIPAHASRAEEIYVRGDDLICRYGQSKEDLFAFQLDWQLLSAAGPFAIGAELWLSVQTDLLDTQPELEVISQAGSQSWQLLSHDELSDEPLAGDSAVRGPAAMVCRGLGSSGEPKSGLWLIEPSDQCHARVMSPTADASLHVRMFGHFMEKGVIRRGRMRFLLSQHDICDADIQQAYRQFAASPLPLTA